MGQQEQVNENQKEMTLVKENEKLNIKRYMAIGMTMFFVFCACVLVVFLLFKYDSVKRVTKKLLNVFQPITIGAVLAYLMNPVMSKMEVPLLKRLLPKSKDEIQTRKNVRMLTSIATLLIFLLVFSGFIGMVLPQLIESIIGVVDTLYVQVERFLQLINGTGGLESLENNRWELALMEAVKYVQNWFEETMVPELKTYVTTVTSGVFNLVNIVKNVFIGLIAAIYVLCEKEKFQGQAKKILYAALPIEKANGIIHVVRKSNLIFGGFIIGKLIDSLIIGIICFVVCAIIKMPYTLLVSVIVGITNIIPFFGPFIGAIPCFFIIVITDPLYGLYFLIFILILQQIDGNIIGPKILGDSTGLSSFWVLTSILVAGGMFGFVGMLLGVPVFAVIYYLCQKFVKVKLRKKGLPYETKVYNNVTKINPETKEFTVSDGKRSTWRQWKRKEESDIK